VFHTAGAFTLRVPTGLMKVGAVKEFEYWSKSSEVNIGAKRRYGVDTDTRAQDPCVAMGWYSGKHARSYELGGTLHNTPENFRMAAAEGMPVIGELIANKDNRVLDYQFFRGELAQRWLLYFKEQYCPLWYGYISLLNLTRT
jgi:hypothetical protein